MPKFAEQKCGIFHIFAYKKLQRIGILIGWAGYLSDFESKHRDIKKAEIEFNRPTWRLIQKYWQIIYVLQVS